MQEVVIKIKGDSSDIVKLGNELKNLGKIDEANAKQFEETNKKHKKNIKETDDSYKLLSNTLNSLKGAIAGAFTVQAIINFGKAMVNVTAEFQKYNAVLTNTLGSQEAAATSMAMIQEFASKTPFSVAELTDSFVKLVNQGFKPTIQQMTSLGDIAASQGKSFDQLTEAIIDAQVGEFERLKEFGIRASKEGENVAFTFKGVTTTVENTSEAMRNYIISLGQVQGVSGGMAKISETLGGKISNLGDSWDKLLYTLGNKTSGALTGTIDLLGTLMDQAIMAAKSIDDIKEEITTTYNVKAQEEETKDFLAYIERVRAATGATFDFVSARKSYIATIKASLEQSEWGSREAEILQQQLEAIYKIKEDPKVVEARTKKAEADRLAAQHKSKKAHSDNQNAAKEELTTLQKLQEAYDKLAAKVDKNVQNGIIDRDLIKQRDAAQRALTVATAKYNENLEEINGTYRASRLEIKSIQGTEMDEQATFNEQMQMMEMAHQETMNHISRQGAEQRKYTHLQMLTATFEMTIGFGRQLIEALNLQGKDAEAAQKGFALADIAISTAKAISALTASSTQVAGAVAAASGPAGVFTGPAAYAAYYGTQIVTILANMLSAKQLLGYKDGTPSLQRNGNPAGVDTIPIMANEGEAIIPTEKNRQKPGLAAAWIKGNLDDYINVNYVIPALKRNKIDKDEAFASRIGKAISMSASFNDMNLLQSDKENRRILRSIDKTLKSGSMGLSRRKF